MYDDNSGIVGVVVFIVFIGLIVGGVVWGIHSYQPAIPAVEVVDTVVKSVEVPKLVSSSERWNVAERAKRFDNPERISYVYLVNYGKVMAFYTAKGKISSLQSYMTPEQKLVRGDGKTECDNWNEHNCYVIDAPDVDGTYGDNMKGIFFFTTEGAYVEWVGDYMMSDQPLKLTTQPELIREIK
jgi:hypothetical protein